MTHQQALDSEDSGGGAAATAADCGKLGLLSSALDRPGPRARTLPPVELWNPAHCGHSDMRITADGEWTHEGRPIGRPALVRLFASVLRREPDGSYVLVTPVEKLSIDVDDAPFLAVDFETEGEGRERRLSFTTNMGDMVSAGPDHPLRIEVDGDGRPRPYVHVRGGLEALIARSVFYRLAGLALDEAEETPGLWSDGCFFPFARPG